MRPRHRRRITLLVTIATFPSHAAMNLSVAAIRAPGLNRRVRGDAGAYGSVNNKYIFSVHSVSMCGMLPVVAISPTVSLRIPRWVLDEVRRIAVEESRTVGMVIRLILEREFLGRKNGRG